MASQMLPVRIDMKTVLVAEDRHTGRELMRTLLEYSGYCVLEAANGTEAIELALENSPDLILLDLQMPGKDGFDVLKELRGYHRFDTTPIVALAASAGGNQQVSEYGFSGYLQKPLGLAAVRRELARLLPE
jgi:two-component system cell cycle response regulator DivK